jgi:hypothetical protein
VAAAVYLLCALTSVSCAALLLREYRRRRTTLLLWTSVSFALFAVSNTIVFADFVLVPSIDLSFARAGTACAAVMFLVFGLLRGIE